jgi:uroporphyrinogen-III synthase
VDGDEARDLTQTVSRQAMQALVTRPREEAEGLALALAARDIGAVIEPMMEVHYCSLPALDLATVQAVLCTSANGVRALARVTGERGLPLLAVGEATAARARAEGFTVVESAGGGVADLARLATERLRPRNGALVHVAGDVVAGDLVGTLRKHGFAIDHKVLYEVRPVNELSVAAVNALRCGMIDFALFFSPRTAAIFVWLLDSARIVACCRKITAIGISAAVDVVLAELPWGNRLVSDRPNQLALLDTLDSVLGERRQGPP